jgi:hypothetical protein
MQQSQQPTSGAYVNRYGGFSRSEIITNDNLFGACMNSRGWTLVDKTSASGSTPYKDAYDTLMAEGQEMCAREDLRAHFRKSPCLPNEATLEQLADRSRISAEEKIALSKVRTDSAELNKKFAAVHRQHNPRNGNALALSLENSRVSFDKIALDLYEGRITRGEYNKRRLELFNKHNDEFQKIMRAS